MKYLLDTNTCIRYLNGRAAGVYKRINVTPLKDVAVCSVVKAEMFYGAARSHDPEASLVVQREFLGQFVSLPFDDATAEVYGKIRARLARLGTPIGPNDLLIAAIALAHDLILVTHNVSEFSRIEGLRLEDWEAT